MFWLHWRDQRDRDQGVGRLMADIRASLPRHVGCGFLIGRLESRDVQFAVSLVG